MRYAQNAASRKTLGVWGRAPQSRSKALKGVRGLQQDVATLSKKGGARTRRPKGQRVQEFSPSFFFGQQTKKEKRRRIRAPPFGRQNFLVKEYKQRGQMLPPFHYKAHANRKICSKKRLKLLPLIRCRGAAIASPRRAKLHKAPTLYANAL